jgi:hypothetical protein
MQYRNAHISRIEKFLEAGLWEKAERVFEKAGIRLSD